MVYFSSGEWSTSRAANGLLFERRAQARGQALAANRRGAYDEAPRILGEAVCELRPLGAGNVAVEALMARLQDEQADFAEAMSPAVMKQRHFRSYSISSGSRDIEGKAKRKAKAS